MTVDPVALAQRLIRCRSVTPADDGALDVLQQALEGLGFTCWRLPFGEAPDGPVDNLFARRGGDGPHFAFAGHSDVVPPGAGWAVDPFAGEIRGDLLHGRGAVDMKGALAAFIAAAADVRTYPGSLSLIVTGDEEGPATFGTQAMLGWMEANGHVPDVCLVGEPTSQALLGDTVKIGRRGSVNVWITVPGRQGHVAYPHLADNPVSRLVRILDRLKSRRLDEGDDWFQPSNLEVTDLGCGNPAVNVIPAEAQARLNIRFNVAHQGAALVQWIEAVAQEEAPGAIVTARISGEAFLTPPGPLSAMIADAIQSETGRQPQLSTSGGTSDARFIRRLCPVAEFGLPNATMHRNDEAAAVEDIRALARIYGNVLRRFFD
jgi:succinyl-diaminopimelate desuccinylase